MTAPTFHRLCGENVRLNSDRHVATREKGFDRGLCALSNPLSELFPTAASASGAEETPPPSIRLVVTKTNAELSGGLGLGVSARAPSSGSSTVLPTNSSSAGKGWAFTQVPQSAVTVGTLVTVWFDRGARELCYSTAKNDAGGVYENGTEETSGELELDDPEILDCLDTRQPLWLYVDVYGFVKEVKLLGAQSYIYLTIVKTNILTISKNSKRKHFLFPSILEPENVDDVNSDFRMIVSYFSYEYTCIPICSIHCKSHTSSTCILVQLYTYAVMLSCTTRMHAQ